MPICIMVIYAYYNRCQDDASDDDWTTEQTCQPSSSESHTSAAPSNFGDRGRDRTRRRTVKQGKDERESVREEEKE